MRWRSVVGPALVIGLALLATSVTGGAPVRPAADGGDPDACADPEVIARPDVDDDGRREALVPVGGQDDIGNAWLVRIDGCELTPLQPPDAVPLGWHAADEGCGPDCGLGLVCIGDGDDRRLREVMYRSSTGDLDGDGDEDADDWAVATADQVTYTWHAVQHQLRGDLLVRIRDASGETDLAGTAEVPLVDGIRCGEIDVGRDGPARTPFDHWGEEEPNVAG